MFLATGSGRILGARLFEKEYLSKIFVAKMKISLVTSSQNYYVGYTIANRKK